MIYDLQEFPFMRVGETKNLTFKFPNSVPTGVTIQTAVVTASVISGTDATPASRISGAATISGSDIIQKITGVLAGVHYRLTCTITTSNGQTVILPGGLWVSP